MRSTRLPLLFPNNHLTGYRCFTEGRSMLMRGWKLARAKTGVPAPWNAALLPYFRSIPPGWLIKIPNRIHHNRTPFYFSHFIICVNLFNLWINFLFFIVRVYLCGLPRLLAKATCRDVSWGQSPRNEALSAKPQACYGEAGNL